MRGAQEHAGDLDLDDSLFFFFLQFIFFFLYPQRFPGGPTNTKRHGMATMGGGIHVGLLLATSSASLDWESIGNMKAFYAIAEAGEQEQPQHSCNDREYQEYPPLRFMILTLFAFHVHCDVAGLWPLQPAWHVSNPSKSVLLVHHHATIVMLAVIRSIASHCPICLMTIQPPPLHTVK